MWVKLTPPALAIAEVPFLLTLFSLGSNGSIERFNLGAELSEPELAANYQIRALIHTQLGETDNAQADLDRATVLRSERGS